MTRFPVPREHGLVPTELSSKAIGGNYQKFLLTFRNVHVRGKFVRRAGGQSFRLSGRDFSIPARGNIIVTPPAVFAQHCAAGLYPYTNTNLRVNNT